MPVRAPFPELPVRRQSRFNWGVIWAVGALAMAGVSVVQLVLKKKAQEKIMATAIFTGKPAVSNDDRVEVKAPSDSAAVLLSPTELDPEAEFGKACQVLAQFLQSDGDDPVAALLRDPAEVIAKHHQWQSQFPIDPAEPLQIGPKFAMMDDLLVTSLALQDGSRRFIAFERQGQRYLLDWSSMVGWGECSLAELSTLPAQKPVKLRVEMEPAEEPDYYRLSHPDQVETVIAYGETSLLKLGEAGRKLAASGRGLFTVELAQVDHLNGTRRLEIRDVIQTGWIEGLQ